MNSRRPSTRRRLLTATTIATVLVAAIAMSVRIHGQAPVQTASPFDMVGFIQKATVDTPGDFLSGGTMTLNGHVVTVPKNTILQMPAAALTWSEVFSMAPAEWKSVGASGLALEDRNINGQPPLATYEVHVQGNRILDAFGVNGCQVAAGCDRYIAGLIFVAQQSLNVGQGYINFIDYTKGEMRVGGVLNDPTTGARIRINDPYAKFSKGDSPDNRFTIDEDNPTVRTQTGFPLCVPRQLPDDQYCPQRNRPSSAPPAFDSVIGGTPFWFFPGGNAGQTVLKYDGTSVTAPSLGGIADSLLPAPFEVGDYISYSGTLAYDAGGTIAASTALPVGGIVNSNDTYISANTIEANLGFYTSPGTSPVYVAIDVMLMGTGGLNTATSPQEATLRTRVEGFSTDPFGAAFAGAVVGGGGKKTALGAGTAINIYAMDVDCTGTETDRAWITGVASDIGVVFGGAVAGRWRFRPSSGVFLPPPRNLRATMSDIRGVGTRFVTKNLPPKPGDTTGTPQGLETGQYNAPIFTYIFPENLVIGGPTIAANFNDFPFLANGSGTYTGMSGGSGVVGQLSPWPLSPAPSVSCVAGTTPGTSTAANPPSVSIVASSAIINAGGTATLTATAQDFNSPLQTPISIAWSPVSVGSLSAPVVTTDPLTGIVKSQVTYSAPASVSQLTSVKFSAIATNAANLSTASSSTISVEQAPSSTAGAPTMQISAYIGASLSALAVPGTASCPTGICSALVAPFSAAYGANGIQIVAQATTTNAAQNPKNNITLNWTNPTSPSLSISGSQSNGAGVGFQSFNAVFKNPVTGATPGLVPGNPPQIFVFKIVATDNVTKGQLTQFVTVTILPPADTLTALVKYRTGTGGGGKGARMDVTVTTTAPLISDPNTLAVLSPQFTLTFQVTDPTDPRFGQTVVWDSWAMVLGVPTATVLGYTMPNSVTVTSSAGGSVTVNSANFTIK